MVWVAFTLGRNWATRQWMSSFATCSLDRKLLCSIRQERAREWTLKRGSLASMLLSLSGFRAVTIRFQVMAGKFRKDLPP